MSNDETKYFTVKPQPWVIWLNGEPLLTRYELPLTRYGITTFSIQAAGWSNEMPPQTTRNPHTGASNKR